MTKFHKLIIFAILLAACGSPDTNSSKSSASATATNQPQSSGTSMSHASMAPPVSSLSEKIAKSEIVVLGTVSTTDQYVNMARVPGDRSQPDSNILGLGHVYKVQVQRYLKGTGESSLNIAQEEGLMAPAPAQITEADIVEAKKAFPYIVPFQDGVTYILFLKPMDVGNDTPQPLFIGGLHPWRFEVMEDGQVFAQSPIELPSDFLPDPQAPLIPQIEQLVKDERAAQLAP